MFQTMALGGRNYESNENGAEQPNVHGLLRSPDGVLTSDQGGYLTQIFVKAIRDAPEEVIRDSVDALLRSVSDQNVVVIVDALLRQLCMTRHIRDSGGKGERDQTYIFVRALWDFVPDVMAHVLPLFIPQAGYWKDCVVLISQCMDKDGNILPKYAGLVKALASAHCKALATGDFLAAKWAPTEGTQHDKVARLYARELYSSTKNAGTRMRNYRKLLTSIRSEKFLVESSMSAGDWSTVGKNLSAVPAGAQQKYKKAFVRQISEDYTRFLTDVATGKAKLNVTGLQIHTIIQKMVSGHYATHGCQFDTSLGAEDLLLMNLTWKKFEDQVVDRMLEDEEFFNSFRKLCVIDQSGSMGGGPDVAALALGLFTTKALGRAERTRFGSDHVGLGDCVLRFATDPSAIKLTPTDHISDYLRDFIGQANRFSCGYSTDMMKVHQLVIKLTQQTESNVAPGLLILTDMQYNDHQLHGGNYGSKVPHDDVIDKLYKGAGISRGEVFCWNLRGNTSTFHAEADKSGVQMIGGFNQSMLTLFFEGKQIAKDPDSNETTAGTNASTWDTFVAAQGHFDCVTEWLRSLHGKIEVTDAMRVKYPAQAMFLANLPADYVSDWTIPQEEDDGKAEEA